MWMLFMFCCESYYIRQRSNEEDVLILGFKCTTEMSIFIENKQLLASSEQSEASRFYLCPLCVSGQWELDTERDKQQGV